MKVTDVIICPFHDITLKEFVRMLEGSNGFKRVIDRKSGLEYFLIDKTPQGVEENGEQH